MKMFRIVVRKTGTEEYRDIDVAETFLEEMKRKLREYVQRSIWISEGILTEEGEVEDLPKDRQDEFERIVSNDSLWETTVEPAEDQEEPEDFDGVLDEEKIIAAFSE